VSFMPSLADYDDLRDELRAEAAAERRRLRPHWCSECRGHTGQGSPCAPDDNEREEEEE
jgi:hypothetical protein